MCPSGTVQYDPNGFRSLPEYIDALSKRKMQDEHYCYTIISNVNIVDVEQGTVLEDQTVVLHDDTIVEITSQKVKTGKMEKQYCVQYIDGTGQYLAPGLADMHVHYNCGTAQRLQFLLAGVTSVRHMGGTAIHLNEQQLLGNRFLLGPTVYCTTPLLDSIVPDKTVANDSLFHNWFWSYPDIDSISRNNWESWTALGLPLSVDASFGLPVSSFPNGTVFEQWTGVNKLQPSDNFDTFWFMSHYWRYYGTYLKGEIQHPDQLSYPWSDPFDLVRDYPGQFCIGTEWGLLNILEYTDHTNPVLDEMKYLTILGLDNLQVLRVATLNPATLVGEATDFLHDEVSEGFPNRFAEPFGNIAVGMRADMVLLPGNPLNNIGAYEHLNGVFVCGTYLSADDLYELEEALKKWDNYE